MSMMKWIMSMLNGKPNGVVYVGINIRVCYEDIIDCLIFIYFAAYHGSLK